MNIFEAKNILKKSGYNLIKENFDRGETIIFEDDEEVIREYSIKGATDLVNACFNIECVFEGTSDYEDGEMPSPYVIVSLKDNSKIEALNALKDICEEFLCEDVEDNYYKAIQGNIEGIYPEYDSVEFVFPPCEQCDRSDREENEKIVKETLINAFHIWGHLFCKL